MTSELLRYVRDNRRVCPVPLRWKELWEMLPNRECVGGGRNSALPIILAAWGDTPALIKMLRLEEHIRYAETNNVLSEVDKFLRGLAEEEWAHLGDF